MVSPKRSSAIHGQLRLGASATFEIAVNYSWFVIALLIILSLATHFG